MIFDGDMGIARAAAERWQQRAATRDARSERLATGDVVAVESAARINARLRRLGANAIGRPAAASSAHAATLVENIGLERVIGRTDFLGIDFLERALAMSRFVGRVNVRSRPGRTSGFGTGFMVSPRLFLTNKHVLPTIDTARHSEVEFDYQYDRAGRLLPLVPFALLPDTFYLADEALDYALVAVAEQSMGGANLRGYGWSRLIGSQGKVLLGESMNVIQHPRGEAKQIVLRANELVDLFGDFAHYVADTEPGSSGSPVYNDQWEVVALHHSGVPRMIDGKLVKKDGSAWNDGDDPDDLDWIANEGIRVSSLVAHIQAQPLDPGAARLRDELLTLTPPDPVVAARNALAATPHSSANTSGVLAAHAAVAAASGERSASVTIPLTLTLTVTVGEGGAAPTPGAAASVASAPATSGKAAKDRVAALAPERGIALAALEAARTRTYYDAAADARLRDAYYRDIAGSVDGLGPAGLFAALSTLVRTTHHTALAYRPAVHLYPWIDLHDGPTRGLRSIYSGKSFDPAEFIESDFAAEAERRRLAELLSREAGGIARERALELLEAELPYNCEHVVPQSWFDRREPMRGDLHHLFACEADCNSFRGALSYHDFADSEEAVRGDCGKREAGRFEPAAGKGAVARATLYFLLRYPGQIGDQARELPRDGVATLLAWHRRDPVGLYERHRCAAIQEAQGNRNPLIDFPGWADRIDFARGFPEVRPVS